MIAEKEKEKTIFQELDDYKAEMRKACEMIYQGYENALETNCKEQAAYFLEQIQRRQIMAIASDDQKNRLLFPGKVKA